MNKFTTFLIFLLLLSSCVAFQTSDSLDIGDKSAKYERYHKKYSPIQGVNVNIAINIAGTLDRKKIVRVDTSKIMNILRNAFSNSNIDFKLVAVDTTYSNTFYYMQSTTPNKIIKKYENKDAIVINVTSSELQKIYYSGIADNIPGKGFIVLTFAKYKKTIVHELGHNFGLYHTHQKDYSKSKNSTNSGDYISQTPPMGNPIKNGSYIFSSIDCRIKKEIPHNYTKDEELILGKNYMSYTTENCRSNFVPEQIDRMYWAFNTYPHFNNKVFSK